jgi:hypothetical protein
MEQREKGNTDALKIGKRMENKGRKQENQKRKQQNPIKSKIGNTFFYESLGKNKNKSNPNRKN